MTIKMQELFKYKEKKVAKGCPFVLSENGHPVADFFKNKRDALKGDDWLIGCLFFPCVYEEKVGKSKPVYSNTIFGVKEWKPILSSRLSNFLESQGPGTTDMQIPLKMEHGGKVYIYTGDGAAGDTLIVCTKKEYNLNEVLRAIEAYHLNESEDDDEEW